jgi:hypothetical protein
MAPLRIKRTSARWWDSSGHLFEVSQTDPATVMELVGAAEWQLRIDEPPGGRFALIKGQIPLPAVVVLARWLCHDYGAVGVFDPDRDAYVVAYATHRDFRVGDLIPASEVEVEG